MQKGLIISQYFPPDITAAAFRMGDLYQYLLSQGYSMDVLTTTPHKSSFNSPLGKKENNIYRIDLTNLSRIKQYYKFYSAGKHLAKQLGYYDFVIVSSPPMFVFPIAEKIQTNQLVLDIRDIWPDSAVATGNLKKGLIFNYFKHKEKKMYKKADQIICVSKPMGDYIRELSGKTPEIVHNGFKEKDLTKFNTPQKTKESKNIIIGYFGNIGLAQNMEILPTAVRNLIDRGITNFSFEIIGSGSNLKKLKKQVKQEQFAEFITFKDPMKRDELLNYAYNHFDVLFINLVKNSVFEKTIPSKVFDYLLLKKPVISGIKGEGRDIFSKTKSVIHFDQNSVDSLTKAIENMINNFYKYKDNATIHSHRVAKNYTREKSFEKIINFLGKS